MRFITTSLPDTKKVRNFKMQQRTMASNSNISSNFDRIVQRLRRHSLADHLRGFLFARKFTAAGIIVVSGGRPSPRVINRGGSLIAGNCQFYSGVRMEIDRGATLEI